VASEVDTVGDMGGTEFEGDGLSSEELRQALEALQRESERRARRARWTWGGLGGVLVCVIAALAVFVVGIRMDFRDEWVWVVLLGLELIAFGLLGWVSVRTRR
jgi:hypothetical protein